jgi:TonB-linked SusC/RagA family outer membrane protein
MKRRLLSLLALLLSISFIALGQERTVTGTVTSSDDSSPLPGVTVVVKNTSAGGVTDINGKFKIIVPEGGTTLVFSFIGFQRTEVEIGTQTTIDVALESDAKQLEEVVVTALGLTTSKDKLGSTSSKVTGDMVSKSGEATLINSLTGKASGINIVRSSGDPGAGSYIQIRGQSTITGNLQPLIVIDGVPIYNSTIGNNTGSDGGVVQQSRLNDLNPDDIENVEILKGASAAALWGTRAANGVIVVTTKKGSAGKGKINVSFKSTYSIDKLYLTHKLQDKYGQGAGGVYQFTPSGGLSWGDKIADRTGGTDDFNTEGEAGYAGYFEAPDGTRFYSITNGNATNPHGGKNSRETFDYKDQLFKTGKYLENSISLSGGDKDGNFFMSFSDMNQDGIIKSNSDYRRTTARVNAGKRFNDVFRMSGTFNYSKVNSNRVQMGSNLSGLYLGGLRSPADFDNSAYTGTYVRTDGTKKLDAHRAYRNPLGAATNSVYDNPLWMMNNVKDNTEVDRFITSVELGADPTSWLNITGRIGVDNYTDRRNEFFPVYASGTNNGGRYTAQKISETQVNADVFARATFDITPDINLTGLVGMNLNNRKYDNIAGTIRSFILTSNPPQLDLTNASPSTQFTGNAFSQIRTAALYATATLSIKDQLFINLTSRAESASTFGRDANATFIYPAADVAWQFTKAIPSVTDGGILTFGKLRAGFGVVGVQPGPYNTVTYFDQGGYAESWGPGLNTGGYGNGGYAQSAVRGNAELTPETKTEVEIGADLRFVKDRITLSATYFSNKTEDAILSVPVAPSTGFTSTTGNAATLENKGVELDLGGDIIKSGDFTWRTNINFTRYRNKVTDLAGSQSIFLAGFTGTSSRAVLDQPVGTLWGGRWDRNDDGSLIFNSLGFPVPAADEGVIGDPNPDFRMGVGNTFSFKGLSFYVLFDRQQGGDIWAGTEGVLRYFGRSELTGDEVTSTTELMQSNGVAIPAGTPFRGVVHDFGNGPVALTESWFRANGGGFGPVAEQFIQDASWTRIREISLSYTLNSESFRNMTKLQSVELSLSGRNLMIWTKEFEGNDPETNLTGSSNGRGLDYFNNPATRSYLFSVRINY